MPGKKNKEKTAEEDANEKFDKASKNYVAKDQKLLSITCRNNKVIFSGDRISVDLLAANQNMTIKDLIDSIVQNPSPENSSFTKTPAIVFPKLSVKFKSGKRWTRDICKQALRTYFQILGFGRNCSKQFGRSVDKPCWWPDIMAWEDFKGTSNHEKNILERVLEALLAHYNIDVYSHYQVDGGVNDDDAVDVAPVNVADVVEEPAQNLPVVAAPRARNRRNEESSEDETDEDSLLREQLDAHLQEEDDDEFNLHLEDDTIPELEGAAGTSALETPDIIQFNKRKGPEERNEFVPNKHTKVLNFDEF